jgi:hypothetical protein
MFRIGGGNVAAKKFTFTNGEIELVVYADYLQQAGDRATLLLDTVYGMKIGFFNHRLHRLKLVRIEEQQKEKK